MKLRHGPKIEGYSDLELADWRGHVSPNQPSICRKCRPCLDNVPSAEDSVSNRKTQYLEGLIRIKEISSALTEGARWQPLVALYWNHLEQILLIEVDDNTKAQKKYRRNIWNVDKSKGQGHDSREPTHPPVGLGTTKHHQVLTWKSKGASELAFIVWN